jgi:hypothetical protein
MWLLGLAVWVWGADALPRGVFELPLDPGAEYRLFWSLDYPSSLVRFELHIPKLLYTSWFAIGFSDYGQFTDADFCILWADPAHRVHFLVNIFSQQ